MAAGNVKYNIAKDFEARLERLESQMEKFLSVKPTLADMAAKELEKIHPGWRELTGEYGSDTEFRVWLGKQPPDYEILINTTMSAKVVAEAISAFKAQRAERQQ